MDLFEQLLALLTLIRMAGGIYDSLNFEQKQLKMAWSKNIFILDLSLKNGLDYILLKAFIQNAVLGDFSIKK